MNNNQEEKALEATAAKETAPAAVEEETSVPAVPEKAEAPAVPEKKAKKKGFTVGKLLLGILFVIIALLILAAVAGVLTVNAATKDTMPAAPEAVEVDMTEFAINAAKEVVTENTITVEAGQIGVILDQVKESVNSSTDLFEVQDLFCVIEEGKGNIYGRVYIEKVTVKGVTIPLRKTIPLQATFTVDYAEPEIIVNLDAIKCGAITIPAEVVSTVLEKVTLPENMRAENATIYYDTTNLDSMVDAALESAITTAVTQSSIVDKLGGILGGDLAAKLASEAAEALSGVVTNSTDVQISGARIDNDKLIIDGQVF